MKRADLPTLLTGARIVAAPLVALLILWGDQAILTRGAAAASAIFAAALLLFALAALTDAADGILARRMGVVSSFGAALDHAADKALTSCALIALAATLFTRDLIAAAILLVGRDMVIAGLREGLSLSGRALPVSHGGKIKTALILAGIGGGLLVQTLVMAGVGTAPLAGNMAPIDLIGWFTRLALWAATILSLWSAAAYVRAATAAAPSPGGGS